MLLVSYYKKSLLFIYVYWQLFLKLTIISSILFYNTASYPLVASFLTYCISIINLVMNSYYSLEKLLGHSKDYLV